MRVLLELLAASGMAAMGAAAPPPKVSPDVQRLLDLAGLSPPEFHAWTNLKLLDAGDLIKDPVLRKQLIEQAFELASGARARYPVRMLSGVPPDSRTRFIALGSAFGLDALSLQVRAVRLMMGIDRKKARQMFSDIPKLAIQALSCDDDLMPDLHEYYQVLGVVAQEAFTAKERQREDHVNFMLDAIGGISSPAQLVPAANMLGSVKVSGDERQLLDAKLGAVMESLNPDDRSFAEVTSALTPLLNSDLMPGFQRFITGHAVVPRCRAAASQNGPIQVTIAGPGSAPAGESKGERLWQTEEAKNIQKMALELRIRNSRVLADSDRAGPEWQMSYTSYVDAIAAWQPGEGESDAVFFHEKTAAWIAAADLATSPDAREYALSEAARFIASSDLENSSPGEWFLEARQSDASQEVKSTLLKDYANSGNAVLALDAALSKMAGANVIN